MRSIKIAFRAMAVQSSKASSHFVDLSLLHTTGYEGECPALESYPVSCYNQRIADKFCNRKISNMKDSQNEEKQM